MSFQEVRFPDDIAYGSLGGPGFRTEIIETDSGVEQRIARWSVARRQYDAAYNIRDHNTLSALLDFYMARQGAAVGFRYKDWSDFTSAVNHRDAPAFGDQQIGAGNGSITQFQLTKTYSSGGINQSRKVSKPVTGTVLVGLGGVNQGSGWSVDSTTGLVTFSTAPTNGTAVTAGFEFDVPVRFGEDADRALQVAYDNFSSGSIASGVALVEIVDEEPLPGNFFFGGADQLDYTADISITVASGRLLRLNPSVANLKVFLPNNAALAKGGPYWILDNIGAGDVLIRTSADGPVLTLTGSLGLVEVFLGISSGSPSWLVLS